MNEKELAHQEMMKLYDDLDDSKTIRENYLRAPFSYPGSKKDSLPKILPLLPYNKVFVDVYGGTGTVILNRKKSPLDVYNDRWSGVVAFYRCVRDPVKLDLLIERIRLSLHSREEMIWCRATWKDCTEDVERAARWYSMVQSSFAGRGEYFGRVTSGAGSIWRKIHENLELFGLIHPRLREMQIENLDWRQCLTDYDSPETVFYLDPPYYGHNIYEEKMAKKEHIEMCERIFKCKGFVALSGYDNPVYDAFPWDGKHTWVVKDRMTTVSFKTDTSCVHGREDVKRGSNEEYLYIKEPY